MSRLLKRLADCETRLRGLIIFALIYWVPAYQALMPIEDPDLWWHMRTAQ